MTHYTEMQCEACRKGAPIATSEELSAFQSQCPQWDIIEVDGIAQLRRTFAFADFRSALAFTNRVGELAEAENHHPAMLTEWGRVTVHWWTHKVHGLHRNDLIMGAKTDRIFEDMAG
jgi:4a-hydroxytetrahydrobiopterin dehydratase